MEELVKSFLPHFDLELLLTDTPTNDLSRSFTKTTNLTPLLTPTSLVNNNVPLPLSSTSLNDLELLQTRTSSKLSLELKELRLPRLETIGRRKRGNENKLGG
jgi:hypothetical protein